MRWRWRNSNDLPNFGSLDKRRDNPSVREQQDDNKEVKLVLPDKTFEDEIGGLRSSARTGLAAATRVPESRARCVSN